MGIIKALLATVRDAICGCGHERNQHSRDGCTWPECGCPRKYMDW